MTAKAGKAPSIAFPMTPKEKKLSPDSDSDHLNDVHGVSPTQTERELSKREKLDQEYFKNRDPMKEFF